MNGKRKCLSPKDVSGVKKSRMVSCIYGQLTARSHILNSSPRSILLEVCTKDSVEYIVCDELKHILTKDELKIGRCYKFFHLSFKALGFKDRKVLCLIVSAQTTWCEDVPIYRIYEPVSHKDLKTIRGKVTDVDSQLGICTLKGSVTIIISTSSVIAMVPLPKVGCTIIVHNAHRIDQENGQVAYAMCVKSYLWVEEEDSDAQRWSLSPVLLALKGSARDYRLILWLQGCCAKLKSSFSNDFLTSNGILLHKCDDFRFAMLENLAKCVLNKLNLQEKSFIEEFFATDHSSDCSVLKNEMIPISLSNLLDFDKEYPTLEDELDDNESDMFWQYDVKRVSTRLLLGVVKVKNVSHRLTFTDAFGSVALLILPKQNQILEGKDLARLNGSVVLLSEYDVVLERFSWTEDDEATEQCRRVRCLAVCADKAHVISSFTQDNHIQSSHRGQQMFNPNKSKLDTPNGLSEGENSNPSHSSNTKEVMESVASESVCISPLRGSPLVQYMSQYIYVQTKATTYAPKQGKSARCCVLVSLFGDLVTVGPSSNFPSLRGNNTSPIFIALENSLLCVHPLITVNTVYELRFPIPFDRNFFAKGSALSFLIGMKRMLPTVRCVTLPTNCEIHLVNNCSIPSRSLQFRDCYGIDQALREANISEFITVKGYIVSRFHQDPRFEREKVNLRMNGFGVPGSKVIALILRDSPLESQTGSPATLYLSNWSTLQYPIALVPGAKVVFRFVMKVIPQIGSNAKSPYFRTSVLSSVEVLELPKSGGDEGKGRKIVLGPRSLLATAVSEDTVGCNWISASMVYLTSVSLSAYCSSCKHPYLKGACSFVGCSAPDNPTFYSQACLIVNDFGVTAVVFVPHALVKNIFGCSEKVWEMIVSLTLSVGQLKFSTSEGGSHFSLEQSVFRAFCKSLVEGQRFHLVCRPFNTRNKEGHVNLISLPVLYAVDISPVTVLMATP